MNKINYTWILKITLAGFFLALFFTVVAEITLANVNVFLGIKVILFFVFLGVFFDMIGTAITAADLKPFNAMAADKIRGGSLAVKMVKNAARIATFLNDVVGDICGIISGSAGVLIAIAIAEQYDINLFFSTILVTAIIAALTIGGKAIGKELAIQKNVTIVYYFARILSYFG